MVSLIGYGPGDKVRRNRFKTNRTIAAQKLIAKID